jgi:plasmid stabilization system protein ParE
MAGAAEPRISSPRFHAHLDRTGCRILWPGTHQEEWEETMSTPAEHRSDLIPRPQQNPDALREALAVVDPARLGEMQAAKDEAFARAVEWQSLSPLRSWVLIWARDIEIARRPDLSDRLARARSKLEDENPAVARDALRELSTVLDEAMAPDGLGGRPRVRGGTERSRRLIEHGARGAA